MSTTKRVYDVILLANPLDTELAEQVQQAFETSDLSVFSFTEIEPGSEWDDSVREAFAESQACVVIVTPSVIASARLAMVIGAAWGWEKPIYALMEGVSREEIPLFLTIAERIPFSELPKVVDAVVRSTAPIQAPEKRCLSELYRQTGVPADQLAIEPALLEDFTRKFNLTTKAQRSSEQILRELFRMRKRGRLPRVRSRKEKHAKANAS